MVSEKEREIEEKLDSFIVFLSQLQKDYTPNKPFDYDHYFDSLNTVADLVYVLSYIKKEIVYTKGFKAFLGRDIKEPIDMLNLIHPEDLLDVLLYASVSIKVSEKIKPCDAKDLFFVIDYRIQKKNGEYARILRQSSALEVSPKGGLESAINLCTDISKIKMTGPVTARMEGRLKDDFYDLVKKEKAAIPDKLSSPVLSAREQEVLHLISKGMRSQDISEKLHVSVHTINTHRRNMLKKLKVKTMSELMMKVLA